MLFRPQDMAPNPARTIAVIGSGIAGLSAAWLLSSRYPVTVFEKAGWAGGHSNTVEVDSSDGPIPVDTGFIVYNAKNYPNLVALFDHLGVATKPSDMSFSASLREGRLEYSSDGLNRIFGQRANILRPQFWSLLRNIVRFYAWARENVECPDLGDMTLGDFLDRSEFSRALGEDHVLPMCAAIWSTTSAGVRDIPMRAYLRFFSSHGLLDIGSRFEWRTVVGGSREYVKRLRAPLGGSVFLNRPARRVMRGAAGVVVEDAAGVQHRFTDVVIAAHADEALAMLSDADPIERSILGNFRYTTNEAVLHSDATLMPKRRAVWSAWNYLQRESTDGKRSLCLTYWMNRLQGIPEKHPLFVTLNPDRDPRPETVKGTFRYEHPVFDQTALSAQSTLWELQGRRRTWFCGSYFGYGFHEDALQSGLAAAEAIGGVRRPWTVENESGRLPVMPERLEAAE